MLDNKMLVIGLDGATLDLIEPWIAEGELPTFARLIGGGVHGRLRTVPNTDTAPAWTTFATGLNPATHGLFHELGWESNRQTLRPRRGADRHGLPFWKVASDAGRQVVVINVPFSYPVETVNGIMVAGVDAPGTSAPGFCYPSTFLADFQRVHGEYRIMSDIQKAIKEDRPAEGLQDAYQVARQHTNALIYALEQGSWDLAVVVYSIPDEMQHFFWQQMVRRSGPQRNAILDGYRFIERQIEAVLQVAGPATRLMLISDHGFGPICATPTTLAEWLVLHGFLRYLPVQQQSLRQRAVRAAYGWLRQHLSEAQKDALRKRLPGIRNQVESKARFIGIDWAHTTAYAGPSPCEVWINVYGREPYGVVAAGEPYEQVAATIAQALRNWRDQQERPRIAAVYRREEVYQGPYLELAPDLTIEWNPEAAPEPTSLPGNVSRFDADHQSEGVLLAYGPGIRSGERIEGATLADVAPTILHLLDIAPPVTLQGRVLTSMLEGAV